MPLLAHLARSLHRTTTARWFCHGAAVVCWGAPPVCTDRFRPVTVICRHSCSISALQCERRREEAIYHPSHHRNTYTFLTLKPPEDWNRCWPRSMPAGFEYDKLLQAIFSEIKRVGNKWCLMNMCMRLAVTGSVRTLLSTLSSTNFFSLTAVDRVCQVPATIVVRPRPWYLHVASTLCLTHFQNFTGGSMNPLIENPLDTIFHGPLTYPLADRHAPAQPKSQPLYQ